MAASTYTQIHRIGTQEQYDNLATKNPDLLYFTSDTGKLYKGTTDYTDAFVSTATVGESGVAGKIYLETSTGQVKTYVGNAWKVISYPLAVTIDSLNASSYKVPSEAGVVELVNSAVGGDGVINNIEQKMNAGTAVSGTITATKGDGSTFDVSLIGAAVNPTWDATTRQLLIPVVKADGSTQNVEVNIGKDIFIDPTPGANYFDPDTKEIVLTLNDGTATTDPTVIRIPASALYNDYTGAATNSGTVTIDATSHTVGFNLNISTAANNKLTLDANGLMVDLDAYATTAAVDGIRSDLQGQIDATTATLSATTAALDTLTTNYNGTTAALNTLQNNYNGTTAALDTLTTNYNATTVDVAQNTADIEALAAAATTWGSFTD